MPLPRSFALTPELLAEHRSGAVLCLHRQALGRSFSFGLRRNARWGERTSRRGEPLGFGKLPEAKAKNSGGATCEACGGGGKCAQCGGVGCTVCDSSGKCTVCEGSGQVSASPRDDDDDDDDEDSSAPGQSSAVVQVVSIRGLLFSETSAWDCGMSEGYNGPGGILERAAKAFADPNAVAVVYDVDSPGGDAHMCGESAAELARMRMASGKPVLVYARQACSAAYYLASAAAGEGGIYVSESSDVGCVGTWTAHVNRAAANKMAGHEITYIEDPPGKTAGNPDQPLSDEARARLQTSVTDSTDRFVAAVAAHRPGVKDARVLRGDTRRGQAAVNEGLADGMTAGLSEVVALAYGRGLLALAPPPAAAPAATTFSVPLPPPEDSMSIAKQLGPDTLRTLGFDAKAAAPSDAAVLGALGPRLALAAAVQAALGEADPIVALVEAPRRLTRAAGVGALQQEHDALRREHAWQTIGIEGGRFYAGEVWTQVDGPAGADGKPTRAKAYAATAAALNTAYPNVGDLEARLKSLPQLRRGEGAEHADDTKARELEEARGVPAISPRLQALARKAGVDPSRLATTAALYLPQPRS